ncbi:MAG: hypothetical protein KUG75_09715 [Pseudomonadales bacterium]|nr:hypothetical protein [Pseudomonadales bacterium]
MNIKTTYLFCAMIVLSIFSVNASAYDKNKALTTCKAHISDLYKDKLQRTTLRKTRARSNYIKLTMKVSTVDDTFKAVCKITSDGELTYTTDQKEK